MAEAKHETVLDAGTTRARLARVYAEALLVTAKAQGPDGPVAAGDELTGLTQALVTNPAVWRQLSSPLVSKAERAAALAKALDGGSVSRPVRGLLTVLDRNNRLGLLAGVAAAYRRLIDEQSGRVRVTVTAAAPLADDHVARLTANLKDLLKQDPVLDVRVDPELLGGLVVRVGDSVVDTSVRSRLQTLRTLLLDKGGYGS